MQQYFSKFRLEFEHRRHSWWIVFQISAPLNPTRSLLKPPNKEIHGWSLGSSAHPVTTEETSLDKLTPDLGHSFI